jgi:AcrR family transcriptional regulator
VNDGLPIEEDRRRAAATSLSTRRKRVRLTSVERRAQIIASAQDCFKASGLAGSRTKEIAQAAGISEAILYQHFESKHVLFEAAVLEPLDDMISALAERVRDLRQVTGRTRVKVAEQLHADFLKTMREIIPLLGVALFSSSGEYGRDFYSRKLVPLWDKFEQATTEAFQGWEHAPLDPSLLARMLLGMYFGLALDSVFRDQPLDVDVLGREITRFVARAVNPDQAAEPNGVRKPMTR